MEDLKDYVVVVSWWGRTGADGEGSPSDSLFPVFLKAAEETGAKLAIHLEPYTGRNAASVKLDLQYIYKKYGSSPALYRSPKHSDRTIIYVYDSYHTPAQEWADILSPTSLNTIRGTEYDAVLLGLYLKQPDGDFMVQSHFDGFYTYFAADGFTLGSTSIHWASLANFARDHNLISSLSVGPGYEDTRIRPWNEVNKRDRKSGQYYDEHWQAAVNAKPDFVSVTSYNEWHEGTQIEASVPKTITQTIFQEGSYSYADYGNLSPDYYLKKTHEWAAKFSMGNKGRP